VAVRVAEMPAGLPLSDLDEKSRLLPGVENGRIDVGAFLTVLRQMGYDGPVTVKPSRSAFQSRRREVIVKQTAEALDKVWRAAGLPPTVRPALVTARDG
jgi:sugar phosphate isomerase/epimerase